MARTTTQKPDEPLPYMQELTRYLSNIMTSVLLGLPTAMKEQIYSEALLHISNALLALPLEESVQAISPQAMTAYSLDVNHLITFVSALNDAKLLSGLDQLKQTVELMSTASMSSDQAAEEFFDAEKARQRFGRVDRAHGAQLLEKYDLLQNHDSAKASTDTNVESRKDIRKNSSDRRPVRRRPLKKRRLRWARLGILDSRTFRAGLAFRGSEEQWKHEIPGTSNDIYNLQSKTMTPLPLCCAHQVCLG